MGFTVGGTDVTKVYLGATPVDAVYLGDEKVWPTAPAPKLRYLIGDYDTAETTPGRYAQQPTGSRQYGRANFIDADGQDATPFFTDQWVGHTITFAAAGVTYAQETVNVIKGAVRIVFDVTRPEVRPWLTGLPVGTELVITIES